MREVFVFMNRLHFDSSNEKLENYSYTFRNLQINLFIKIFLLNDNGLI